MLDNPKENHSQIRELVLKNTDIQLHISKIISETEQKISTLPENYQDQMKELLGKFSHL